MNTSLIAMNNTPMSGGRFEPDDDITAHVVKRRNNSSRFSINSEENASELIENREELLPRY